MKIWFVIILLFSINIAALAQNRNADYIGRTEINIPDSCTYSPQKIANYIQRHYNSDEDRLRVLFKWIADNIIYDVSNMYNFNNSVKNSSETLKTRRGVCKQYADLYCEIANRLGIKTYVIEGYTKQGKNVSSNPHAWCASMIDSSWFIIDPTWGAGVVEDSKFIKHFNSNYFKINPKKAIKTYMPFDPLWQFLEYPITNQMFCNERKHKNEGIVLFSYKDTLKLIENQSYIENLKAKKKRIENNIVNSYLVYSIVEKLSESIEIYYYNKDVMEYDSAFHFYNEGIYKLNQFIDFRNKQFQPDKEDTCLIQMIDSTEWCFNLSMFYLKSVEKSNYIKKSTIDFMNKSIKAAMTTLNEQKKFLDLILKTPKQYRKSLFYDKM